MHYAKFFSAASERVLVGLGISSEGLLKDFEVIDVDDVTMTCKNFPDLTKQEPGVPQESFVPDNHKKSKFRKSQKLNSTSIPDSVKVPENPATVFRLEDRNPVFCRKDCFRFESNSWQKMNAPENQRFG